MSLDKLFLSTIKRKINHPLLRYSCVDGSPEKAQVIPYKSLRTGGFRISAPGTVYRLIHDARSSKSSATFNVVRISGMTTWKALCSRGWTVPEICPPTDSSKNSNNQSEISPACIQV